jgi:hypothetical protein
MLGEILLLAQDDAFGLFNVVQAPWPFALPDAQNTSDDFRDPLDEQQNASQRD